MWHIKLIILTLLLQGCSSIKELEIFTKTVEREPLALDDPILPKLEPIQWLIITSENAEEVFAKMSAEGIDPVIFGLSDNDYKLVAKNFAHIRNTMKKKSEIIKSYKEYYESDKKTNE